MEKIPMTPGGLTTLENELKNLKSVERPSVIRALSEARDHGDLSENAEYHAARERQSFIEGRITELEDIISRAQVIESKGQPGDAVRFGATVTLSDDDDESKSVYTIVGAHEADIKKGRMSVHSPLARALIGKKVGDTVEVTSPGGFKSYEVVKIKYD